MKHLIETDCAVDYLAGQVATIDAIHRVEIEGIGLSLVSYGELYEGIVYGRNPHLSEVGFDKLLRLAEIVTMDVVTMQIYGRVRGDLRRRGLKIGDPDIMIAASALQHDLVLITRNTDHFGRINGLKLYDWSTPDQ